MENKSITIQDVAREAGVSVATVSRVLNNSPLVKKNTTSKVQKAIDQLGYQPNFLGRDLRRAETMRVLLLTQDIGAPITGELAKGMDEAAKKHGYYLMVCPTDNSREREEEFLQLLKNKFVDGLIVIGSTLTAEELDRLGQKYSIVQCAEWIQTDHICSVSVNDEKAALDAVNHLIKLGHKRIAMISSNFPRMTSSKVLRESGYRKALQNASIPFDDGLLKYGDGTYEGSFHLTNELLQLDAPPTAIFCYNDVMAIASINAIKEAGYDVPSDIAVVGFDDTKEALMSIPQITTIYQPKFELGYRTMELLIHNMTNNKAPLKNITIDHKLIVRGSSSKI
ncbi:LacI family DNA-binding transcriptional regulator [Bacillus sp. FJAT-49711]|uniref:LacI family DNA-binding transcriptional regulator n=1 Tax=Bacillus sp. FJAT-49711 TaxID=2833585 RepID=UPI001BC9F1D2|nr:LacI family DNA-binding transcriptional regulator [Bacillus sp. FJAT-49711]MBS4219072.1 LacI family DNA-binding transcriptional regulator [Bacillus sp. FJAT-49711]